MSLQTQSLPHQATCFFIYFLLRLQLYNAFPSLFKYLPGPHQTVLANYREIERFLKVEVQKHVEQWNPEQPRDFIDEYIAEIEKVGCSIKDFAELRIRRQIAACREVR